jgi:import receptor subunit TOM20
MLTCLDYDLHFAGTHCAHCLREIQPPLAFISLTSSDGTPSQFCSKPCQVASKAQYYSFLFTLEPPLPAVLELSQLTPSATALEARRTAQAQLTAYLSRDKRVGTTLVAKFLARQLTAALASKPPGTDDYTQADGGEVRIEDYVERWPMGAAPAPPPEECALLVALLRATLPGLEAFVTEDVHKSLLGKMAFNAFGVCFGGGRDNRVRPSPSIYPRSL